VYSFTSVTWKGNDGKGDVWLSDNIDTFDGAMILFPAYSTLPEGIVNNLLKRTLLGSSSLFSMQVSTAWMHGESFQEAILDPEVSLSFFECIH
jgi:hypothetical protein